jgi:hypothetical protein
VLGWLDMHVNALVTQEFFTGPTMLSSAPVIPEQGLRTNLEGMQENTDAARLLGSAAAPLTLLTELAGATVTETGRIDQSQTPVSLVAFFCGMKSLSGRTTQRAIRLQHKVTPAEATLFEWQDYFGWGITGGRCRVIFHGRKAGAKSVVRIGSGSS